MQWVIKKQKNAARRLLMKNQEWRLVGAVTENQGRQMETVGHRQQSLRLNASWLRDRLEVGEQVNWMGSRGQSTSLSFSHVHASMILVPPAGQSILPHHKSCFGTAKEREKWCKTAIWSEHTPHPNLSKVHGTCLKSSVSAVSTKVPTANLSKITLGRFYGLKNIYMNTRTWGFLLYHCTVAMMNVIRFICH